MIDIRLLIAQGEARQNALRGSNYGPRGRLYDGPRADAEPTDQLPRYRLSDPRDVARLRQVRHEPGCMLAPAEDRYVCVTHGVALGWLL